MPTYLDRIVAEHRATAAADRRPLDGLVEQARACAPARPFAGAIRRAAGGDGARGPAVAVVAEVKRRSPSRGDLAPDLDPARLAAAYERGGAACVSVLTDAAFFGARPGDLAAARGAVTLPVLRKDFTVCAADVCDARMMGADAVLLIAAVLDDAELADLHTLASELGLDALVEVHDEAEAERALRVGAGLIGVNQRDLQTFEVDTARAVRVGRALPEGVVRVAESGIGGPADVEALAAAGYHAVLVGESLVRAEDPEAAVRSLRRG